MDKFKTHLGVELIPSTFIAREEALLGSAAIVAYDMDTRTHLSPRLASFSWHLLIEKRIIRRYKLLQKIQKKSARFAGSEN